MQLRRGAVKEYGSLDKGEEKPGFKPGSMKNYVEAKVTAEAKHGVKSKKKSAI